MHPHIGLYTLGALNITAGPHVGAAALALAGAKRFALLAFLALVPHGVIRRDLLVSLFWPEHDVAHARSALRSLLHQLRNCLGDDVFVTAGDHGVGINRARLWCDAVAFGALCDAGRANEALALYRGPFLPGFHLAECAGFSDWADEHRARLHAAALEAADRLITKRRTAGDCAGALRWARRRLQLAPYQESALRTLVSLLLETGDRAEAVQVATRFTRRLAVDLRLAPTRETRRLVAQLGEEAAVTPSDA